MTRELIGIIRITKPTVNKYQGGVLFISPSDRAPIQHTILLPILRRRAVSLARSVIQLEHSAISRRLPVLRTSRPSMAIDRSNNGVDSDEVGGLPVRNIKRGL